MKKKNIYPFISTIVTLCHPFIQFFNFNIYNLTRDVSIYFLLLASRKGGNPLRGMMAPSGARPICTSTSRPFLCPPLIPNYYYYLISSAAHVTWNRPDSDLSVDLGMLREGRSKCRRPGSPTSFLSLFPFKLFVL